MLCLRGRLGDTPAMRCLGARCLLLGAVVIAALAGPTTARAQETCTPSEDVEEARSLFIAGSQAVDAGRWADAIESFERSYELSCAPSALYNLAMALRALGRHRDARDAFDRLLRLHPDLSGELRQNADTHRREVANRVAILELVGIAPERRPEITFDGAAVPDSGARPIVLETDAGRHSLVARIPDHQAFLWDGSLTDGQRETIEVSFLPLPEGGGFDALPLILGIVAAGLVAGGVAVGYVVWDEMQIRPLNPDRVVTVGGT